VAVNRLVKILENRMARMQLDVLGRLSEQIESLVSTQTSKLRQSADEFASQNQRVLSAGLQKLSRTAAQEARNVQGEAAAATERALEALHSQVAVQLSKRKGIFLGSAVPWRNNRSQGLVDSSIRTLSLRIEEVSKEFEQVEGRTQKILLDTTWQLEQHAATRIDETTKHIEAQLKEIAERIYSSFQEYSSAELNKRQQAVKVELRENMQAVSEPSLQEVQGALARMFQGLVDKMRPSSSAETNASTGPGAEG